MTVIWSSLVSLAVIIACIFFMTAYLRKTVSPEMSLMVAESSCTELACSVAPWAKA